KSFPQDQQQPDVNAFFFQQHGPSVNENAAPAVGVASDEIRVSGGSGLGYTGVNPLFDAKWHHLVVTYDENFNDVTDNLMVTIYLDGNQEYNQLFTATGSHLGPELSHILIGAENDLGETYNAFAGYVDEFAIYDRILNYPTIYVHYEAWQPKSCAEVIERGLAPQISLIDTNQDCIINLFDLATIADNWLLCTDPRRFNMDPDCVPVW
ncbi:MAG: LamG-like jellyroll fold domain-containing protein, partial [Phycisphaerae bacterium]